MNGLVYTDGASRGNPGQSGIGAVLFLSDTEITVYRYIGVATNNEAEYQAAILGLTTGLDHGVKCLTLKSDSEVIIRQLEGKYAVRSKNLIPLCEEARRLISKYDKVTLESIPREQNEIADHLANLAINTKNKEKITNEKNAAAFTHRG